MSSLPSLSLPASQSITYGGVQIWDEGTVEDFQRFGRSTAVRTIVCTWQNRITLINTIMGAGGINAASQYFYNPDTPYPDAPFLLFIDKIHCEGITGPNGPVVDPNGMVGYDLARLKLTYSSLPYDYDNLNVTSLDYATEEIVLDPTQSTFYWNGNTSTPVPAGMFPSLRVAIVTLTITQYNQVEVPAPTVMSLAGNVNSSAIMGCGTGTLRFDGCKSVRRLSMAGIANYDCTFQFTYNPQGWNNKYLAGTGWTPIADASNKPPFTLADLTPLGVLNPTGAL